MRRLSVAGLMGVVGVLAAGMAAVRLASPIVLDLVSGMILLALAVGLLGVVVGAGPKAGWRGFALFGWGYFLYVALPWPTMGGLHVVPTERLVLRVVEDLQPHPIAPARPDFPSTYDPVTYVNGKGEQVLSWPSTSGGSYTPLTLDEIQAWTKYKIATLNHEIQQSALEDHARRASQVCHLEFALIFAILGSVAGRHLGRANAEAGRVTPADRIDPR